ncbi:MAG TPA: cation:dicarboxylase symporter family transporter [Bacteroidetes bacterium]|nr:cation:dicarboxylase symporter family transporter [Bacteroidota bacterium]
MKLYTKITIGLVAGVLVGWLLSSLYNPEQFEQADVDGNNFVSIPELLKADGLKRYKNADAILKADQNKDEMLTWAEILDYDDANRKDSIIINFEQADLSGNQLLGRNEAINKGGVFAQFGDANFFAIADTNGDGGLTMAEVMLAELSHTRAFMVARFDRADVNKNGNLSQVEVLNAGNAFAGLVDRKHFAAADENMDKALSMEEIGWTRIDGMAYLNKNGFLRADQNEDHQLSRNEEKAISGAQRFTAYTDPIGAIFIRLVKMVVVPLILASLILGAANLGDVRKLGSIGLKSFGFFTLTTAIAVSIGVLCANVFRPGDGLPETKKQELLAQFQKTTSKKVESVTTGVQKTEFEKIKDLVVKMVPTNPIKSLADGDMLAIIFFALFTGICITLIPWAKAETFVKTMEGVNEFVLKMVMIAMEAAPYGVFALIVGVVADMGIDILLPLLKYGAVVVGALLLHLIFTYFSFIFFYLKQNPLKYMKAIKEALLLGFSTSSSSATLPISLNVAQKNLNVSNDVSSFVLPLGATINMDGTALYQGVAAIFIAQVYGIDLSFTAQIVMVLTATLASVGAAGVPGAGMITLAVVLSTAGIPVEGIALIFGLDRLLDMFRTMINITGDITCAAVMAKSEGEKIEIFDDRDIIPG